MANIVCTMSRSGQTEPTSSRQLLFCGNEVLLCEVGCPFLCWTIQKTRALAHTKTVIFVGHFDDGFPIWSCFVTPRLGKWMTTTLQQTQPYWANQLAFFFTHNSCCCAPPIPDLQQKLALPFKTVQDEHHVGVLGLWNSRRR